MHTNASSILFVSHGQVSLTPKRAAREGTRVKSRAFVRIGRPMDSQQLGADCHTLAPVRVKTQRVYEAEDTEMVRNREQPAKFVKQ